MRSNADFLYFLFLIGLCGAVHTGVARYIRNDLIARQNPPNSKIFCVGDKSRSVLQRTHGDRFIVSANEVSSAWLFGPRLQNQMDIHPLCLLFSSPNRSVAFHPPSWMLPVLPSRCWTLASNTPTVPSYTTSSSRSSHTNAALCQFSAPKPLKPLKNWSLTIHWTPRCSKITWNIHWHRSSFTPWRRAPAPNNHPVWAPWTMHRRTPAKWLRN